MIIRKLYPRKGEGKIIELAIPIRFYWKPDGSFDCIETGPFEEMSVYENILMESLIEEMGRIETGFILGSEEKQNSGVTNIPKVFLDAFKKKAKDKED